MANAPSKADLEKASKKTLKVGSKGKEVEVLQQQLNVEGSQLDVDGVFGNGTRDAVKKFQKSKSLAADGIVGKDTWGALQSKQSSPPSADEPDDNDEQPESSNECVVNVRVVCPASRRGMMPVQAADVKLGKVKAKTKTNGDVSLTVSPGKYTLEVSKRGFKLDVDRPIQIRAIEGGTIDDIVVEMKQE